MHVPYRIFLHVYFINDELLLFTEAHALSFDLCYLLVNSTHLLSSLTVISCNLFSNGSLFGLLVRYLALYRSNVSFHGFNRLSLGIDDLLLFSQQSRVLGAAFNIEFESLLFLGFDKLDEPFTLSDGLCALSHPLWHVVEVVIAHTLDVCS